MNTLLLMSGATFRNAPLTFLIIALTIFSSYKVMDNPYEKSKLMFNAYAIQHHKEWFRFFSHGLVHADWRHLGLNMFVLYMFGPAVEMFYQLYFGGLGTLYYLLLYGSGLAMSSVYSYFKHKNNAGYNALGASGAVAAVVFASILFQPTNGIGILIISDITGLYLPAFVFGILYLMYSAHMSKQGRDNIGHDAHYWGSVWGFIFTLLFAPELFVYFLAQIQQYLGLV